MTWCKELEAVSILHVACSLPFHIHNGKTDNLLHYVFIQYTDRSYLRAHSRAETRKGKAEKDREIKLEVEG